MLLLLLLLCAPIGMCVQIEFVSTGVVRITYPTRPDFYNLKQATNEIEYGKFCTSAGRCSHSSTDQCTLEYVKDSYYRDDELNKTFYSCRLELESGNNGRPRSDSGTYRVCSLNTARPRHMYTCILTTMPTSASPPVTLTVTLPVTLLAKTTTSVSTTRQPPLQNNNHNNNNNNNKIDEMNKLNKLNKDNDNQYQRSEPSEPLYHPLYIAFFILIVCLSTAMVVILFVHRSI